jgi:alpha-1,2-mannosyltransferase
MIKPQLALMFVLGLLRADWALCAGFLGTGVAGVGLSLLWFRPSDYIGYLRVLSQVSRYGEAFYPNQSVNGLLHRLLFNGDSTTWPRHGYPPYHPVVYVGTLLSSLFFIAVSLWVRHRPRGIGRGADFALAALVSTMASPIAWEHHYGILAPIFAFLVPPLWKFRPAGRWTMPALAVCWVLSSNFIAKVQRLRTVPVANVLQSYLLAAALAVGVLLVLLRRQDPPVTIAGAERASA